MRWYVLRDLKRSNARMPAYRLLSGMRFEVFTPMCERLLLRGGRRVRERVPFIPDLLFVRSSREAMDPVVERVSTIQYRYVRGGGYREPMVVPGMEMDRFIRAVESSCGDPVYYRTDEITPAMYGREVRVIGGALDGYEGRLLRVRGSKSKRLIVELPGFFAAGVEVEAEYIRFVREGAGRSL